MKLGAPVAIIGKAGEDVSALVAQAAKGSATPPKAAAKPEAKAEAKPEPKPAPKPDAKAEPKPDAKSDAKPAPSGKVLASPLAKSLAIELGIDLRNITGSGPGGRIVERDVKAAADGGAQSDDAHTDGGEPAAEAEAPAGEAAPAKSTAIAVRKAKPEDFEGDYEDIPASNMRKRIAQRLTEAKRDIPHFYLQRSFDVAALMAFRGRLNDLLGDRGKISVNDLVIKAVALALRRVPECNASWQGDAIRRYHRVHVGVAVAIEDGLVTPVVRDADQKGIGAIAVEVKDLAARAKSRQLKGHEITGSTFTVSNLGMYGIERFTAILNPPEAGILAIGATLDVPVVDKGAVVAGKRMTVSMSCDHRVIDGALGSRWLQALAEFIEKPESLAL